MEANRDYFAAFIGVSSPQLLIMGVIAETPEPSVSAIADRLGVSTQFVATEIGKLVVMGGCPQAAQRSGPPQRSAESNPQRQDIVA
jgi:DNA-binding MarR family transcriptional regulator